MNTPNVRYEYFRSIGRSMDEITLQETFIGYVSLTKYAQKNSSVPGHFTREQQITFSYKMPLLETHPLLRKLPIKDVTHTISAETYEILKKLAAEESISVWIYLAKLESDER
nr:hypothetical protein [Lysinibacillus sphaericus]